MILLSPQGRLLTQAVAEELSHVERLVLICGRYEGVDERVAGNLATDEISIGDFVLSGGELPAAVLMEATIRLLPGVLGNEESREQDSFGFPAGAPAERGTGCSTARTTRARRSFAIGRCRKFCFPGTTSRFASGGGGERWKKPGSAGPICLLRFP